MKQILLLLPVAMVAGCQTAEQVQFEMVAKTLPVAEAAAKQAGVVTDGKALRPNPPVPPVDNAAIPLKRAYALVKEARKQDPTLKPDSISPIDGTNPAEARNLAARLKQLAPALEAAVEASQRPRLDYARDWGSPTPETILFPELADSKSSVKVLAFRGVYRAYASDPVGSSEDFAAAFRICRLIGSKPTLIAGLVEVACTAVVARQMEYAVTIRQRDAKYLTQLSELARQHRLRTNLRSCLASESVLGVSVARRAATDPNILKSIAMTDSEEDETDQKETSLIPAGVSPKVASDAFLTRALEAWTGILAIVKNQPDDIKASDAIDAFQNPILASKDPTQRLNKEIFPVFSQVGLAFARGTAYLRCFQGLVATVNYRNQTGRFPSSLKQAGFTGIDPFDGKPIRYRNDKGQITVYSIDTDRKDDQGQATPRVGGGRDTVCTFPRLNPPASPAKRPPTP
jgi:hypothetical protein